jgi:hypothetical protein
MNHVRPSILSDCDYISKHIREHDERELGLWDMAPKDALIQGYATSFQPMTIITSSMPCAMFGAAPFDAVPGFGIVWLIGTPELFCAKVPFVRQSSMWLEHICRPFGEVGNWVDSRNRNHLRWLKWLGFTVTDTKIVKDVPVHFHHLKVSK